MAAMEQRWIHIIGGGTIAHVRPHLALAAPAYGGSARFLAERFKHKCDPDRWSVRLHLTRMAGGGHGSPETNGDVGRILDQLVADPSTGMIVMPVALCDFQGAVIEQGERTLSGKEQPRLKSREGSVLLELTAADKLIGRIRRERKDVFLVGFKTTAGATADEQYLAGLTLLKSASCNLVLANDLHSRTNMIVTPELARYAVTPNRDQVLDTLVTMALSRSDLTFSRTQVQPGDLIDWESSRVPSVLRTVVEHCVSRGAYKPFRGVTVGHFACRESESVLLSSRRKKNFNLRADRDLVQVQFDGSRVTALGAKPSAGARSQYEVLNAHPGFDCIVHFHCPIRSGSSVPVRPQWAFECGSHECGRNTADGIERFGAMVGAVMLDQHGPNIVFSRDAEPAEVIAFIEEHFDLSGRTDEVSSHLALE
jgi:hypothetical protein